MHERIYVYVYVNSLSHTLSDIIIFIVSKVHPCVILFNLHYATLNITVLYTWTRRNQRQSFYCIFGRYSHEYKQVYVLLLYISTYLTYQKHNGWDFHNARKGIKLLSHCSYHYRHSAFLNVLLLNTGLLLMRGGSGQPASTIISLRITLCI